jgi:peptidoglycan/xylan/chitin deacetylase (PgdA/CDA1 family)
VGVLRRLRSAASPAMKSVLFRAGTYAALRRMMPSRNVAILRYHAVCDERGYAYAAPGICITPEGFEAHVRYLSRHYAVRSLPEVVERLRAGEPLPANCVAITFDDGYADNLPAARVLARYGATATFYITAGCMHGGEPFWPAEIRPLVAAMRGPRLQIEASPVSLDLPLGSEAERTAAVRQLTRAFKSNVIPVREALRQALRTAAGHPAMPRVMLNWDEVREMHEIGMTIGSHTMTHPNLPSAGPVAARHELAQSRARLEQEIQAPVTMFSYPNGGADRYLTADVQAAVRESGYAAATTSRNAFATAESDLYALERIEVEEDLAHLVFALEVERFLFQPKPRLGEIQPA